LIKEAIVLTILRMGKWFRYLMATFLALWQTIYFCNASYILFGNVRRECVSMGVEAICKWEVPHLSNML